MRKTLLAVFVVAMGAPGCSCGKKGKTGVQGPPGPETEPPHLLSVSPESGSWRNFVTITGENFVDGSNEVYFDGDTATIVSESATQIVVQPTNTYLDPGSAGLPVAITVITAQQASNALTWQALPSGTPRITHSSIPTHISDVATDGTMIYYADARRGILTADPANQFATGDLRGLGTDLQRPGAMAYHATYGLVVVDDVSVAGDLSQQRVVAVDITTGATQVLIGSVFGLADATDIAVDATNGDIYIVLDLAGTTNPVWRLSDADGLEPGWGNANLDSDITSVAVVGSNVYVGGTGANAGLFEFVAGTGGGGAVNTLKVLDNAVAPRSLAPNGTDLMVGDDGADLLNVANLGMSPSNVTQFSNFTIADAPLDLTPFGTGFVFTSVEIGGPGLGAFSIEAVDANTSLLLTMNPFYGFEYGVAARGSEVFLSPFVGCGAFDSHAIHRITSDGSMSIAAFGSGICNYTSTLTSTGLIVTSDLLNDTVSVVDLTAGTVTPILDATDGVDAPFATVVGPGDAVWVAHNNAGDPRMGLTDVTGSTFDASWSDTITVVPTYSATLGGNVIYSQFGSPEIFQLDPSSGTITPDFIPLNQMPGAVYGMAATPDGSVVASVYDGQFAGIAEFLDTGAVWPLYRSELTDDINLPIGIATMPDGDYLMVELGQTSSDGDLITVTP